MRLSGGERQRISLARAFLKDAPILILDEPTSSVDVKTEAVIMEAMERLMSGRTSFMIAHRLSTLDVCDLRLEMDGGRIVNAPPTAPRRERVRSRSAAPDVPEHPAVAAWLSLGGAKPRHVTVLKSKRFRKRGVYRLEGAGPGGSPVIAKICKRKTAEVESAVYEELLPGLPCRAFATTAMSPTRTGSTAGSSWRTRAPSAIGPWSRSTGAWPHAGSRRCSFMRRSSCRPRTCRTGDRGTTWSTSSTPAKRSAGTCAGQEAAADGPVVLADLLSKLDAARVALGRAGAFCATLPQTVVHGDLVPKNLRILRDGAASGWPSSTGRQPASGFRLPTWRSCWSPSVPGSRARAVEAARSVLCESLP